MLWTRKRLKRSSARRSRKKRPLGELVKLKKKRKKMMRRMIVMMMTTMTMTLIMMISEEEQLSPLIFQKIYEPIT